MLLLFVFVLTIPFISWMYLPQTRDHKPGLCPPLSDPHQCLRPSIDGYRPFTFIARWVEPLSYDITVPIPSWVVVSHKKVHNNTPTMFTPWKLRRFKRTPRRPHYTTTGNARIRLLLVLHDQRHRFVPAPRTVSVLAGWFTDDGRKRTAVSVVVTPR